MRTYQPQQVNSTCKESSYEPTTGKGEVSAVSKDVMQYLQLETVLYKHQPIKHYPQLDMRTYQPQQVNSTCKESSYEPTTGKGEVSAVSKDVMQYLQLETVLYKHQPIKHYPQLDIRTYQPQRVYTSRQESFDGQTSREEQVSTINQQDKLSPQWLIVPNQQQTSKPYPQLDIRIYQPQQVDTSRQES